MADIFKIPFTNTPEEFEIKFGEIDCYIKLTVNASSHKLNMCIINNQTKEPIASCIPLLAGVNLFAPFARYGLRGTLFCVDDNDINADPTIDTIGISSNVYYQPEDE